jgi:thiol reductant ABC exporter CydD subunit
VKALDPRLLRHAAASRRYVAVTAVIAVSSGALLIVAAFAISELVVRPFQDHVGLAAIRGPLIVLALVVTSRAVLAWGGQVAAHRAAADVKSELRHSLLEHAVRLGPAWLARQQTGDLATLATSGTDAIDGYFAQYLPALLTATFLPAAVIGVVFTQDAPAGLIILFTLPLIPAFAILIGRGTERATRRQWRTLAVLGGQFLDVLQGLPTLLLFGRAEAQTEAIRRRADDHRTATMKTLRVAFLSSAALEFVATISVAIVAVSVGLRLLGGSLDLRTGLVVLVLAPEAYWPLRQVGAQFHASAEGVAAAKSIFAVIEEPSPVQTPRSVRAAGIDLSQTTLRIEGLSVQYDRDRPALICEDLVVRPGEYLGIAGPSGCGKTTLLWVLLGFVAPTTGRVVLDGPPGQIDLAHIDPQLWRSQMAWVPQDPWFAPATIADNVRLARPDADSAEIAHALDLAHATEFVAELPDGAATVLGENGVGLSAGQRQRIALARAFLRDAPLVLLDEATAHLDADSEAAVADAVRRLARNRTVIAVAHRPALLDDSDRLVFLGERSGRAAA